MPTIAPNPYAHLFLDTIRKNAEFEEWLQRYPFDVFMQKFPASEMMSLKNLYREAYSRYLRNLLYNTEINRLNKGLERYFMNMPEGEMSIIPPKNLYDLIDRIWM